MTSDSMTNVKPLLAGDSEPASTITAARGARAVCVLAACCSLFICVAALGWWAWRLATGGPGYNSAITVLYAAGHAALAGVGILLSRTDEPYGRLPRGAGLMVGLIFVLTPVLYLELALGLYKPRIPVRETPYESDVEAEWRMKANYVGEYGPVALNTNSEGFRSPEIALAKPANTVRVICLGDSLTFGHGVEERFAYPQILQRLLTARMPERSWEVVNTGVEGYSTFQETAQLRRCMKFQPDLVVVLFCMNDVTEKYVRVRAYGGTGLGYHGVADGAANLLFKAFVAIRPYSSIATFLTPKKDEAERRQAYAVMQLWQEPEAPQILEAWEQAEKELAELAAYCRENDLGFLLAVAPFATQLDAEGTADAPQRRLKEFAARQQIAMIDLWPHMDDHARRIGKKLADFYIDRSHFTEAGNQAIAEIIADQFTAAQTGGTDWATSVQRVIGRAAGQTR